MWPAKPRWILASSIFCPRTIPGRFLASWRVNATGSAAFIAPIRILEFHFFPPPTHPLCKSSADYSCVVFSPLGNHHFRRDERRNEANTLLVTLALFPYRARNFAIRCVRGTRGIMRRVDLEGEDRTQYIRRQVPTISTRLRESANVRLKSRRDTDSRMLFALR